MGQITIEIPSRKRRHYVVSDARAAEELISALDRSAIQVKNGGADATDAADVRRALEEYRRIGKTYSWDSVKKELGL